MNNEPNTGEDTKTCGCECEKCMQQDHMVCPTGMCQIKDQKAI